MSITLPSSCRLGALALALTLASATGRADDPVRASFDRMLDHRPSAHVPPVPGGSDPDPLIAALVRPLLQAGQYSVAGAAAPAPL